MAELMTVEEVADYLRLTKTTIYRLLKRGDIPAVKIGRVWRFEKTAIDDWLHEKSVVTKANILVVDDEESILDLFKDTLEELGHEVTVTNSSLKGLELVKQQDFDLAFLDLKMSGMNGAELFGQMKTIKPKLQVTIITGYPESEMMARALAQGPFGVMNKPFDESDIVAAVNSSLRIIR